MEGTECKVCALGCIECVDRADKCSCKIFIILFYLWFIIKYLACIDGYYLDPLD